MINKNFKLTSLFLLGFSILNIQFSFAQSNNINKSTPSKIKILNFNKSIFTDSCKKNGICYTGTLKNGARWIDKNGDNVFIISERLVDVSSKTNSEVSRKKEIYADLFVKNGNIYKKKWNFKDSLENYCDLGIGLISDIIVLDSDYDGFAENMFVYNLAGNCDVSPLKFSLLIRDKNNQSVVTSNISDLKNDKQGSYLITGLKKDAKYNLLNKDLQKHAINLWKQITSKVDNKFYKNSEVSKIYFKDSL